MVTALYNVTMALQIFICRPTKCVRCYIVIESKHVLCGLTKKDVQRVES